MKIGYKGISALYRLICTLFLRIAEIDTAKKPGMMKEKQLRRYNASGSRMTDVRIEFVYAKILVCHFRGKHFIFRIFLSAHMEIMNS